MFTSRTQPQIVRRTWEPWQPKGPALRVRVSPGVHPHRLSSTAQVWLGIPRAAPRCGAPLPPPPLRPPIAAPPFAPSPPPNAAPHCRPRFSVCGSRLVCCSLLLIAARCVRACARVRARGRVRGRVRACVALKRSFRFKKLRKF